MYLMDPELVKNRQEAKFTVLKRKENWDRNEVRFLGNKLSSDVYQNAQYPDILIIEGEHSREKIIAIIGRNIGEYRIIEGYENPDLPFLPHLC